MGPEDNPLDEVEVTEEEWKEHGEAELADLRNRAEELQTIKETLSEHVLGGDSFELAEVMETILGWHKLADQECLGCAVVGPASIIDKFPKINKLVNGKVTQTCPAYPGMAVYQKRLRDGKILEFTIDVVTDEGRIGLHYQMGYHSPSEFANTREAAEAGR